MSPARRAALALVVAVALLAAGCTSSSDSSGSPTSSASGAASAFVPSTPASAAGDVVSAEPYSDLFGASTIKAYRVSYLSGGKTVTGAVLAPLGDPPATGWPVIAWDHGTTGLADSCAPSRTKDLGGVAVGLVPVVQSGYVVAATDYPGLGSDGVHPYLNGASEGGATIDIVRAARQLVPGASTRWLAFGHSQGGHAALFAGQLAATQGSGLELVGVVALAPASQLPLFTAAVGTPAQTFLAMVIAGLVATDPSVSYDDLLGPEAAAKADVFDSACAKDLGRAFNTVNPLLAPGAATKPVLVDYLAANDPGHQPINVPVLIAQGDADTTVLPSLTRTLVDNMCAQGDTVELHTYPGADHTSVIFSSLSDARAFIAARLAGAAASSTC
jgi:alpha-beta hydrolase superfamily lysophospholipase